MKMRKNFRRRSGWALAITLLMAFMLAAIAGVSLTMTTTNRKVTDASFSFHAMQPVAESGVDSAMRVIHRYVELNGGTAGITGSSPVGSFTGSPGAGWVALTNTTGLVTNPGTLAFAKNFGVKDLGDGRRVTLKVKVANVPTVTNPTSLPCVISDVAITADSLTFSPKYSRQFIAQMGVNTSVGSGMIALNSLRFSGGNIVIDAYDSSTGAPSAGNRSYQVTVGSPLTSISIAAVSIYGFVAVAPGGAGVTFSKGAHVWDALSPAMYQSAGVDPGNLSQTFDKSLADFPPDGVADILKKAGLTALPAKTAANTIVIDSKKGITLGGTPITGLTSGVYYMDTDLALTGKSGSTLSITGNVSIIMGSNASGTPLTSGGPSLSVSGSGGLYVANTSPTPSVLNIYTSGNVDITGNGILSGTAASPGQPSPSMIYLSGLGTALAPGASPKQSIKVAGNGAFSGVIYAPVAALELRGGGSSGTMTGSIVAWDVSATGNANFHYDVNLAETFSPNYRLGYLAELTGGAKVPMPDGDFAGSTTAP